MRTATRKASPVVAEDVFVDKLAEAEVHDQQLEHDRRGAPEPDVESGDDGGHRVPRDAHDAETRPSAMPSTIASTAMVIVSPGARRMMGSKRKSANGAEVEADGQHQRAMALRIRLPRR